MFQLDIYMAERARRVETALEAELPGADVPPAVLHRAMRYSVFSGGKRIRPVLCLAAAEAVGAPADVALLPALAVELLHTYTLIHDDLPCMDDDDFRRGKPTAHKVFGEANAVLAGDALQALAFDLAARGPTALLVRELAAAAGSRGVVGGQVADLSAPAQPDAVAIAFIHLHKTADLFKASVRMGAIAGGSNDAELAALTEYAQSLGLAFQITDDLLDEAPQRRGARPDLSCLSVYPREEAQRMAGALTEKAIMALRACRRGPTEPLAAIAIFVQERKG